MYVCCSRVGVDVFRLETNVLHGQVVARFICPFQAVSFPLAQIETRTVSALAERITYRNPETPSIYSLFSQTTRGDD